MGCQKGRSTAEEVAGNYKCKKCDAVTEKKKKLCKPQKIKPDEVQKETNASEQPSAGVDGVSDLFWIGFDLGGTKMQASVFNSDFKCIGTKRKKTKAYKGQETGLERIIETVERAIENSEIKLERIKGIGVGSPGPLDLDKGIILETPNLGWGDVPLKETLEKKFKIPVMVANDVDAGLYGEYLFGAAQDARCAVGVFPGTGIGGACVYEGELLRGRESSCMEIGHMQVVPNGSLCGCGRRGCLETVASRLAVSSAAAAAAYRGQAPYLAKEEGMDLTDIRSKALKRAIENGDNAVEQIVSDAARWLGVGIANVVNLLAPDIIVLGGGMVEALADVILKPLTESARSNTMPGLQEAFNVVLSELGDDATVMGAAGLISDAVE